MTTSKITFLFLAAIALPTSLYAAKGPVLVSMTGDCTFKMGDAPAQRGTHLMYMNIPKSGRAEFTVPTDLGVIGLAGGKDIQVSASDYLLKLDSIVSGHSDGTSTRTKATGKCQMKMSADGDHVYSVECSAETEFGPTTISFVGDQQKVSVMHP